jgi:uncharacterized protein (TIGR01777 family)
MNKKIVITGATGLIGRRLSIELINEGNQVTVVSRSLEKANKLIPGANNYVTWNHETEPADFVNGNDVVIHLMGENIMSRRWTAEHKKNVYNSRIESTRKIVDGIKQSVSKPSLLIHSSAIGYYGIGNFEADESSAKGSGFLADVVDEWEKEAERVEEVNVRRVSLRLGIVLDKNDGALKRMVLPFRFFIGGPLGSGKQWFPWISIDDVIAIFKFAIENTDVTGAVNTVSQKVITMNEFAKSLGKVLNRPSLIRVPEYVLKMMLGEAADALIYGVKVIPKKLNDYGYKFKQDSIESALRSILS